MAISVDQAMSSYGYVFNVANAIPELKTYLDQAIANAWTPDNLIAQVQSSPWWAQHADTVRNLAFQQFSEPATYAQNMANAKNRITLKAEQLGRSIDDATATSLAYNQLTTNAGWDDNVLSQAITNNTSANTWGGYYHGQSAQLRDHMTQVAQSYGLPYTDSFLDEQVSRIQNGVDTLDSFQNLMQARAKATYPPLADQIDAGMTVRDVADPYISTMAQTLEVPTTSITLDDPYVKKALTARQPDGTATVQPLWQFTRALKDDPRYDKTTQAKTDAYAALGQIGKDWGFVGN